MGKKHRHVCKGNSRTSFKLMKLGVRKGKIEISGLTGHQRMHHWHCVKKRSNTCHKDYAGFVKAHQVKGILVPLSMEDRTIASVLQLVLDDVSDALNFNFKQTAKMRVIRQLVGNKRGVTIDFVSGNAEIKDEKYFEDVNGRIHKDVKREVMCPIKPVDY